MPRIVYQIAPGARMEPGADGQYEVTFGEGGRTRLSPPALMPLLLVDGWRSQGQIEQLIDREHRLPAGIVEWLFSRMASVGLLVTRETAWRPVEWLEWPTHRCQSCGACCQGEWIGPLDPEFVAMTLPRLEGLREKYPALEEQPAFVRLEEGSPSLHLNSSSGQCVFLDTDMRCILHKEFGAMGKPALCRTFPLVRFEDEARTRIGVGLMCLKHFDQVLDEDPPGGVCEWQAEHEALDGGFFHYYAPDEATASLEEDLLEALGTTDDAMALLLARLARRSPGLASEDPALRLERNARRLLARLDDLLSQDEVLMRAAGQKGLLPARLTALRALAGAGEGAVGQVPVVGARSAVVSAARARVVDDLLQRFLFLRQYLMFRSMATSLAAVVLGLWAALALAPPGEARADATFGEYLATFTRAIQSPAIRRALFEGSDEVDHFLGVFRQWWTGFAPLL